MAGLALPLLSVALGSASTECTTPKYTRIAIENELPGDPSTEWDINGAGDPLIQGFATDISVPAGSKIDFKVRTNATTYRVDIYRMGYYKGLGARRVHSFEVRGGQAQPDCRFDSASLLVDCANWAVSFSWAVPGEAVSGIYFARLVRPGRDPDDTWREDHSPVLGDPKFAREGWPAAKRPEGGWHTHAYGLARGGRRRNALREPRASHAYFVVRDDSHASQILFQTMDTTWQAYNCWGTTNTYGTPCSEPSLHAGSPPPPNTTRRAYKASYNRPFATRSYRASNMPFNAEYPMVRWLERNGFEVAYWTGVDADRHGERLATAAHQLYLSVGHDEYWSGAQRRAVTKARDRGMHLAFFSGNEVYWRTRWEDDHRTLVVYKETQHVDKLDPMPGEWTGTWRDGRPLNPLGAQPENALTGTIYTVNAWRNDPLHVPSTYSRLRFWRNTSVARLRDEHPYDRAVLVQGLLGHEWDEDIANGHRPAGLIRMSRTVIDDVQYMVDEGATYDTGTATHHLTLYRHQSGALVFGAGTCQWSWGLDGHHDLVGGLDLQLGRNCYSLRVGTDTLRPDGDRDVQQATLNLLLDMGVVPSTPQAELQLSPPSTDKSPPTVGRYVRSYSRTSGGRTREGVMVDSTHLAMEGSSEDAGGGVVAAVELSFDGGASWTPADVDPKSGRWSMSVGCTKELMVRAADDSGNLSPPHAVFCN